jgi:hypothetical protein
MRWGGRLPRRCERRHACVVLLGKREENRYLGRHRLKWEANIKMVLKDIEWNCVKFYQVAEVRDKYWAVVDVVMNFHFPYNEGNISSS